METWGPAAWTFLTAIVGTAAGLLSTRGKNKADAVSVLTTTALGLVNELQEELVRMRSELAEARKDIADLKAEVADCEERYDRLEARLQGGRDT